MRLPGFISARLEQDARALAAVRGPAVDFEQPAGEPALVGPDSVSWQVFRNPVALFVGGIAAVLLELAEPRVRHGVWDHTTFRTDPLRRMRRTGLAAMVTVYGARSIAEAMISGVGRMHGRVSGETAAGAAYRADDPELLDWVQATASFGFLEAYSAFVRPVGDADKDRYYAEGGPSAALYGATGAPGSLAELQAQFEAMRPKLERSAVIFEFLDILRRTPVLPGPRGGQLMMIRAAVDILPGWARETLGLEDQRLKAWERSLVRALGRLSDRILVESSPSSAACRRLGLPSDYLHRRA
ncbi:MAG TPA: oxygenase MpaB family protein [Caulobacteraceae bacterium]|nr:oxygenase MpaB family protein [Caulobacteraceae bacterium]